MTTYQIGTTHPAYDNAHSSWMQCRDCSVGQQAVKYRDGGYRYLPPTPGMWLDSGQINNGTYECNYQQLRTGTKGWRNYESYKLRALFIPFIHDAADMILGMLWNKLPQVKLPSKMEYVLQRATPKGQTLYQLWRKLNYEQIVMGRAGLLVDPPLGVRQGLVQPKIGMYRTESIINWDADTSGDSPMESLNLVVLDESGKQRKDIFEWEDVTTYRVLMLGSAAGKEASGLYRQGVFSSVGNEPDFNEAAMFAPNILEKTLNYIPFTFVGSCDNTSDVDVMPLLGLSDICLALYRMDADYRQAIFMNTQDTLFTKGFTLKKDSPLRIGAGAHVHSDFPDGDMKYVGTNSQGLPEIRQARENDMKMASHKAGELMDASSRARESGVALEMRIGTKTATLNTIAYSGGEGIKRQLQAIAEWIGIDPKEVDVQPNQEFASKEFGSQELLQLVQSKMLGGPISYQSIHKWAVDRGYTKLTFDEMMKEIEDEQQHLPMIQGISQLDQAKLDLEQQQIDNAAKAAQQKANQKPGAAQ